MAAASWVMARPARRYAAAQRPGGPGACWAAAAGSGALPPPLSAWTGPATRPLPPAADIPRSGGAASTATTG